MLIQAAAKIREVEEQFAAFARAQLEAERWLSDNLTRELNTRADNQIDIVRRVSREYIAAVRARYAAEISAARDAMDAQISMYQQRISEIDNAIRDMGRQAQDDNFDDRIRRLSATLAYEVDASNIHAINREIERLTRENNQRLQRQALEDERALLRDKITEAREHFAVQQRLMNDLRDEEIRLAEERVEIQMEALKEQQEAFKAAEAANSQVAREELSVREEHLDRFLRTKIRKNDEAARSIRQIMNLNNFQILSDMEARLHDFFIVGHRAGTEFFSGFREGTGGMAAYISDLLQAAANNSGGNDFSYGAFSTGLRSGMLPGNSFNINIEQDFNVPVLSPSRVADETAAVIEGIVRRL